MFFRSFKSPLFARKILDRSKKKKKKKLLILYIKIDVCDIANEFTQLLENPNKTKKIGFNVF